MYVARHFCTRYATHSHNAWSMWIHITKCAGYEYAFVVLGLGASGEVFPIGRRRTRRFRSLGMRANDPLGFLCGKVVCLGLLLSFSSGRVGIRSPRGLRGAWPQCIIFGQLDLSGNDSKIKISQATTIPMASSRSRAAWGSLGPPPLVTFASLVYP